MNGYIEAVGVLAAIIDLGMSVPQTIRLYRSKRVDGVSTLTWIVLYATFSGWCLYGYVNGSIGLSIGFSLAWAVIGILLLPMLFKGKGHSTSLLWLVLIGIPGTIFAVLIFAPDFVIGIVFFSMTFNRIPQVITSWRSWRNKTNTVVSKTTYGFGLAANITWLTYGILRADPIIIGVTILTPIYDILILLFEGLNKRSQRRVPETTTPRE